MVDLVLLKLVIFKRYNGQKDYLNVERMSFKNGESLPQIFLMFGYIIFHTIISPTWRDCFGSNVGFQLKW
jgi:hypothetical protein